MDRRRFVTYIGGAACASAVASGCRTAGKKDEGSQVAAAGDYKGPTLPDEFFAPLKYNPANPDAPTSLPSGLMCAFCVARCTNPAWAPCSCASSHRD